MQDPPKLVVAQFDPGLLLEVLTQPIDRPNAEAVAQVLRRRVDGELNRGAIFRGGPRDPSRRTDRREARRSPETVGGPNVVDRRRTAAEIPRDRRLGLPQTAHENNRRIAENACVAR